MKISKVLDIEVYGRKNPCNLQFVHYSVQTNLRETIDKNFGNVTDLQNNYKENKNIDTDIIIDIKIE